MQAGYRDSPLVGTAQETGMLDEVRGVVGDPMALRAGRAGAPPFPDGTIRVMLAWQRERSAAVATAYFTPHAR